MGSVESVKAVSDIYSPVSGEVIEINDALSTAPKKLNESRTATAGWSKSGLSAPDEIQASALRRRLSEVRREEEAGH
jgi:glycine cleavage system H protein